MATAYVSNQGSDANDGLTPDSPKRSIVAALKLIQNNSADWLLLRRGDRWDIADEGGAGKGVWRWDWHGISEDQRCGIGWYGDQTQPRPVMENGGFWYGAKVRPLKHFIIEGVEFYWSANDPGSPKFQKTSSDHRGFFVGVEEAAAEQSQDITVSDCVFRFCPVGAAINASGAKIRGVDVSGNAFIDCINFGLMMQKCTGSTITDNRFVDCGWQNRTVQLHAVYTTDCELIMIRNNLFYQPGNFGLKFSANSRHQSTHFEIADNLFIGGALGMGHARLDGSWNPLVEHSHAFGLVSGNYFERTAKDFPAGSKQFQSMGINIGNLREVVFTSNIFAHNPIESGGEIFRFADPSIERSQQITMADNHVWAWASRTRRQQGSYITNLPADTVQLGNLSEQNIYREPSRSFDEYAKQAGITPRELAETCRVGEVLDWIRDGFEVVGQTVEPTPEPEPKLKPQPEPEPKSETLQLVDAIKELTAAIREARQ